MFCPKCGASNDAAAAFCMACGDVMPLPADSSQTAQEKINEPAGLDAYYKAVLGPKNQEYYLRQFARFDADGKVSANWHWPGFFITFYWMLYRKMWLYALCYFLLPYLFFGLIGLMTGLSDHPADPSIGLAYLLYFLGIFILLPMYANAIYYKHCRKKILSARGATADMQKQMEKLSSKGGVSNIVFVLFILALVWILAVLAAVAIPAYQSYTSRAHTTQSFEQGGGAAGSPSIFDKRI